MHYNHNGIGVCVCVAISRRALRRCLQKQGARHHGHSPPGSAFHSQSAPSSESKCQQHAPGATWTLHSCSWLGIPVQSRGSAPRTAGSLRHCGPWADPAPGGAVSTWARPSGLGRSAGSGSRVSTWANPGGGPCRSDCGCWRRNSPSLRAGPSPAGTSHWCQSRWSGTGPGGCWGRRVRLSWGGTGAAGGWPVQSCSLKKSRGDHPNVLI